MITILSEAVRLEFPLLSFEEANQEIIHLIEDKAELQAQVDRLMAKLLPIHWLTAPEVIKYLEDFLLKLDAAVERDQVRATILAIKRLQDDPGATHWAQPRSRVRS